MAISVAAGAPAVIVDYADGFVVQIREVDDVEGGLDALLRLRTDVEAMTPEPPIVSAPVVAPGGPALRVVGLDVDEDALLTVLDLAVKRLHDAGVGRAVVDVPEPGGALDGLDRCPNAVVLRVFPQPAGAAGALPARWIDLAAEWVLGDSVPTERVPVRVLGLESELPVSDAPAVLHQAAGGRAWCDLVHGALDDRVRTASLTFGTTPHLALAAGGPACDRAALLARYELLAELARGLAPEVAYACIDFEETFEQIGLGFGPDGWAAAGGASPNLVAGRLADLLVPDVFPYQVLGPAHLERFVPGADPQDPPIGRPLAGGRIEVTVGDPEQWLPLLEEREDAHASGLRLLAPLLATDGEVAELLASRPVVAVGEPAPTSTAGVPNLDKIRLETLPHSRRGLRLTFLELVAWMAGEPHSDAPTSVSPVIATFARWFASALDDARRQQLKPRAEQLIGTAAPADRSGRLAAPDAARAWLVTDWLIRVQAARWLRAAGLVEAAGRLESAPPSRQRADLVRTVDVLSTALVIATRRIELTASVAADGHPGDAELVQEASWEAWEVASEASGWVAASEAAAVGVPAELAYATDVRVVECARDPRLRAELEASGRTIGDATWAAALKAVADAAWTAGWEAAHRAGGDAEVVDLETALERARRAVAARSDELDLVLERAEVAAVERLAQGALDGRADAGDHPWDAALAAAAGSDGGDRWTEVHELAAAAVGAAAWAEAMAAARAAVDEVLDGAPDVVARAVAAALAKETASAAARGIAGRACAVSRAQGADPLSAADAAHDVLAPTVEALQEAALGLLDELIAPPSTSGSSGTRPAAR